MQNSLERTLMPPSYMPSEEGLKLALAAAQAGLFHWQLDTNTNVWSEELWAIFGLDRSVEPSFDNWLRSVHPEDRTFATQTVSAASQCRIPFEIEWRTNPEAGPVRWLLARGQACGTEPGPVVYTGIVMDISSRKRAEHAIVKLTETLEERVRERSAAVSEHERLLQNILDGVPGQVGYWTRDLLNRFANKAYRDGFAKSLEEMRLIHMRDLLGPERFAQDLPHIEAVLKGEAQRFELQTPVAGKPGHCRHHEAHYLPDIDDGQVKGFLLIVFDISQVKEAELAAEAANHAKSEFIANISHEVRTPLNAMFGLAQVGSRLATGTTLAMQFEQILNSAQHLLALLNDVLDFSKIESGKLDLHMERINLGQMLDHVLALKAVRAQAKGLPLVVHEGPTVPQYCLGDATRISQVLINLISNAVKFTSHGQVDVRLGYTAPELVIEVIDTGLGMSQDKLERLFKPFVQVHGHHPAQTGGTGLGLAITKRLIDMMNGRIHVQSEAGKGSVFKVMLPLELPESGDFHAIRSVALIGQASLQRGALRASLAARGAQVAEHDTLPDANELDANVIVLAADLLPNTCASVIRRHLLQGRTFFVHSPASTAIDLPPSLQNDLAVIAGPLSPLRLLNAIKARLVRPAVAVSQRLAGLRILVAEDNPVNRLVLQQMLEQEGAALVFAFDGAHALEQARVHGPASFDVMLCDIQMPVMDGYQAAQALRHLAPGLPIIGLTAHAFDTAKQQARDAGMVGYVTKPYMLNILIDEIRRYARPRAAVPPTAPVLASSHTMSATEPSSDKPQQAEAAQQVSDWEAMQQYFSAQPHLLDRLIGMLTNTLSEIQVELDQAVSNQNMDALAKVAHNVKGTALNLHTPQLADLAIQTQEQAKRAMASDAIRSAEQLSARLSSFIEKATQQQASKASAGNQ